MSAGRADDGVKLRHRNPASRGSSPIRPAAGHLSPSVGFGYDGLLCVSGDLVHKVFARKEVGAGGVEERPPRLAEFKLFVQESPMTHAFKVRASRAGSNGSRSSSSNGSIGSSDHLRTEPNTLLPHWETREHYLWFLAQCRQLSRTTNNNDVLRRPGKGGFHHWQRIVKLNGSLMDQAIGADELPRALKWQQRYATQW